MNLLNFLRQARQKVVHYIFVYWPKLMTDKHYLSVMYRYAMGEEMDWSKPETFNQKLQWLKVHDHNPVYTTMVDKYAVKGFVSRAIGEEYIIPTLGVWEKFDDIDFDSLPTKFVLKCTHDSGGIIICRNKASFDKVNASKKIMRCLNRNFYYMGREWPYKNVPPRIIAEPLMEDDGEEDLKDYKLMCFGGKVKCSFVCTNRSEGLKVTFFNREWQKMPFERHYPASSVPILCPKNYDEMVYLAEKLAEGIPFVRVDFYEIKGKTYFGELTFYPGSGFEEFRPQKWDKILGSWIELPHHRS